MLTFNDRQKLVEHCTHLDCSSTFYRDLYGLESTTTALKIKDESGWRKIPYNTKEALTAKTFDERSFLPLSELDNIRVSSGTSGKPPLFSPRTPVRGLEYHFEYHDFKRPILAFYVPTPPHWYEEFQAAHDIEPCVIAFDPTHPAASVLLARDVGVDSIFAFAYHIPMIGKHMRALDMHEDIRFIEICGEACSRHLFEYIRETFPNAFLLPQYGTTEVEDTPIGVPCRPITGDEPLSVFHAKSSHYLELVDPQTLEILDPKAGTEGELVVTSYPGEPASFPHLRYRLGDIVRIVDERCAKHGDWSFAVLGRDDLDFVKVAGGVIRADEITRVLSLFRDRVSDAFQLNIFPTSGEHGPTQRLVLHVEPRGAIDLRALARDIEASLRTGPSFTLAMGVRDGRYPPLECVQLGEDAGDKKSQRIVQH